MSNLLRLLATMRKLDTCASEFAAPCASRRLPYRRRMKRIRSCLALGLTLAMLVGCAPKELPPTAMTTPSQPATADSDTNTVTKTEAEWRKLLTPEQYHVLREAGTERAHGKAYEEFKAQGAGTYVCGGCGAELFSSAHKFDSHCGWPSFYDPANAKNVRTREDRSFGGVRVEVLCAKCNGHLGHVFKGEGFPTPTDQRYCINGVSLKFVPKPTAAN